VVDFGNGAGNENIFLAWPGTSGQMTWSTWNQNGWASYLTTNAVFPQGRWVHVAATVDEAGLGKIYWDGQQVASGTMFVPPVASRTSQHIGLSNWWWSDAPLSGALDEVKIWSVARAPQEIQQDMTQAPEAGTPGLVAYYPFDEGQGTVAHDAGSNHYDGTLVTQSYALYGYYGPLANWNFGLTQAIDLSADGPTPNASAPRVGPNNLQNFPVLV
jgi:hypothetical protein